MISLMRSRTSLRNAVGRRLGFERRRRLEGAQVVVDRELHVHVQHPVARQQERDVGDAPAGHALLPQVVDALDQAGRPQHVVGHPLAPLPAGLGAGQRLAEALGGLDQVAAVAGRLGEARS